MSSLTPAYSRPRLHHKGYAFCPDHWRNQRCGTKRYWRCKYDKRCTARIRTSTEGGEVVRELGGHNHPPMERSATTKTANNRRDVASNSNVAVAPVVPPKVKSSPTGSPSGLRHKGYAYSRDGRSRDGTKQYWYCKARHAAAKCPARIHTLVASGEVLQEVHEHNHPPVEAAEAEEGASHLPIPSANSNIAVASFVDHQKISPARIGYQHNGYAYNREYRSETKQYWSCKWRHKAVKCMPRLHTSIATGEVVYDTGDHNHPPMDSVQGKYTNCTKAHNSENHQTGPSHPKKPCVRKRVNASNNSTPATTDASTNNCNPAKVVERFMALVPAKRATVASLFRALLDEMENDGDDPQ
ncbi:FLYWCH-type zinc finger-containing protein 1 isoform 4 [Aphelenchoides avenae]|nr:FLYWCH-type zinc finger-containing protein 1 isoform 4 [Aphelenchus avenae]